MYDVNMDQILKIPNFFYKALSADLSLVNASEQAKEYAMQLRSYGYLKADRVECVEHPATYLLPALLEKKLTQAVLQVTQRCNLRCEYCIYSGNYETRTHSQKDMPWEVAKKAMDYLISHSADNKAVTLSFYGGEPLLRFDLIKRCVLYMENHLEGKELIFNLTTNGTIMTPEIADFMNQHRVGIMFSLDGPEKMHNQHRKFANSDKGSFHVLMNTLTYFETHFPEYAKQLHFNSVIDTERDYDVLSEFMNRDPHMRKYKFLINSIDDAYTENHRIASESYLQGSEYEYFQFLLSKAGRFSPKNVSKLAIQRYQEIPEKVIHNKDNRGTIGRCNHHGGPCIPGVRKIFINVDGDLFPCERISETSTITKLGHIDSGIDIKQAEAILNIERQTHDMCKDCWAYRYCTSCVKAIDGIDHYNMKSQLVKCSSCKSSTEAIMKDYCVLREAGYDFFEDKCGEIKPLSKEASV